MPQGTTRSEGGGIVKVPAFTGDPSWWISQCESVADWLGRQGATRPEALWLLPQAAHVAQAQAAWARGPGGWMPRILPLASLQGQGGGEAGGVSLDPARDRWQALKLLRASAWGRGLGQRDPRAFDALAKRLQTLARGLAQVAASQAPEAREAWLSGARARLGAPGAAAEAERALARLALEWAVLEGGSWVEDALVPAPSALVLTLADLPELPTAFSQQLGQAARARGLPVLEVRVAAPAPGAVEPPRLCVCESFEEEAVQTAAQVLRVLPAAEGPRAAWPVALVAQDRRLIRRVRALLEGVGVGVADETGWTLSTTRAAASLMGLLRLAPASARSDELLEWLKSSGLGEDEPAALDALEAGLRRQAWTGADPQTMPPARRAALAPEALQLWQRAVAWAGGLRWPGTLGLAEALERLGQALADSGLAPRLDADDAGRQVLGALHLLGPPPAWVHEVGAVTAEGFTAWVDAVLEASSFHPAEPEATPARVRVLPLARALWRPFAAVVLPAADASQLGAPISPWPWVGAQEAEALGLTTVAEALGRERWAFDSLLALPELTLLRRRAEGDAELAPSPLLERLQLALAREGRACVNASSALHTLECDPQPVPRPEPRVHSARPLWPAFLHATACEALRTCPYQFHARVLLGLREPDELDDEIEPRDVGEWLHEVLHRFHQARQIDPQDPAGDLARLMELARAVQQARGLSEDGFLPHAAWFETFAPRYLAWLAQDEVRGHHFLEGEIALEATPPALQALGLALQGRIDRIDRGPTPGALRVLDYKSGSVDGLKRKLADPREDTQLAFYVALLAHGRKTAATPVELSAAYLPLAADEKGFKPLGHPEVAADAQELVDSLAHDWARMAEGEPLRALGEGRACEHCEMRGLCRRDHWSVTGEAAR